MRFRYLFRPGEGYDGSLRITLTTQMTMEGLPAEAAAMMGTLGKDLRQEILLTTRLDVGRAGADGALPVDYGIVGGSVSMTMAGQPLELPGIKEAIASAPRWHGRLTSGGTALDLAGGTGPGIRGLPDDTVDRLSQGMPPLPEKELKVGDSFEAPLRIALPGVPMAGRLESESRRVFKLTSLDGNQAIFETVTTITGTGGDDETARMRTTIEGGGPGRAVFDLKEGIFTEMSTDLDVKVTLELPFPSGPDPVVPGENAAPQMVRVHAAMRGVSEYRLSRAPATPARSGPSSPSDRSPRRR